MDVVYRNQLTANHGNLVTNASRQADRGDRDRRVQEVALAVSESRPAWQTTLTRILGLGHEPHGISLFALLSAIAVVDKRLVASRADLSGSHRFTSAVSQDFGSKRAKRAGIVRCRRGLPIRRARRGAKNASSSSGVSWARSLLTRSFSSPSSREKTNQSTSQLVRRSPQARTTT